jgi:hypothetical protein
MSRNSKEKAIPSRRIITPDNVGEVLFEEAKKSKVVCLKVGTILTQPGHLLPRIPRLPDRELVNAARVFELACSDSGLGTETEKLWHEVREKTFHLIRLQTFHKPPLLRRDIFRAIRVLKSANEYWNLNVGPIQTSLTAFAARHLTTIPKGAPRRGNRISEHHQRVVAALELFRICRIPRAAETVARLLYNSGVNLSEDGVRRVEGRYKKALNKGTGIFVAVDRLPHYWLQSVGWHLFWIRRMDPKAFFAG